MHMALKQSFNVSRFFNDNSVVQIFINCFIYMYDYRWEKREFNFANNSQHAKIDLMSSININGMLFKLQDHFF